MSGMSGAPERTGTSGKAGAPSGAPEMSVVTAFAGMRRVVDVMFKAACPDCRAGFELTASALRLAIGASSRTTFYSFTCPECGAAVRKPAGERIVELLTGGGVRTLRLHSTL
ncbi:hypothetical protein GCM10011579_045320 [Streptomyces albiflavescens]|uniref:Uncharacterized protein n=2 Tax=Streptomyces albiflavescens TaxID=1623582 RepID=A0A917Y761_9ACTN|nr:hypothetical protein GCM10011579_045320 [Streptomyces albiflavescens]